MNGDYNDFTASLGLYYNDLKKYNALSKAEERILFKKIKKGDKKARNKIISANLRFVFDVAKKYKGKGLPMGDLVAEGNMGLIKAIEKFDTKYNVKFYCYAVWWIRASIIAALRKNNDKSNTEKFEDEVAFVPSTAHLLDDDEDENVTQMDVIMSDQNDTEENEKIKLQKDVVSNLLKDMNDRERYIIEQYYGLNGEKEHTLLEISHNIEKVFGKGITMERVRQIKKRLMYKMKTAALCMSPKDIKSIL